MTTSSKHRNAPVSARKTATKDDNATLKAAEHDLREITQREERILSAAHEAAREFWGKNYQASTAIHNGEEPETAEEAAYYADLHGGGGCKDRWL
jgi:FtsZ-interacting cell division protein ZipA